MVNTKIKTLKPPRHVKHVLLVFIPSVPPPCARIAKKASFKNWRKLSNTVVNFVPKQQHSIRPVARVLHVRVVNIKNKIPQLRSHASIVPLEPNGQQLQMCVMRLDRSLRRMQCQVRQIIKYCYTPASDTISLLITTVPMFILLVSFNPNLRNSSGR